MTPDNWVLYLATATILTMTPGLDTAMVLRSSAIGGTRQGMFVALGIGLGCLCWGTAAACGLGALFAAWPLAFTGMKLVGACYLAWLGARLLLHPRLSLESDVSEDALTCADAFRRGFTTNILNPKVGLFYVTLLPQFVPVGGNATAASLQLALAHVCIAIVWFMLLAGVTSRVRAYLRRPGVAPLFDRLTGGVFVSFGLALAVGH